MRCCQLGESAIIAACRKQHVAAVKFLLKFKPLLHLVDRSGYSAIRWAVIHANMALVRLLLEHGTSITKVPTDDWHYARVLN